MIENNKERDGKKEKKIEIKKKRIREWRSINEQKRAAAIERKTERNKTKRRKKGRKKDRKRVREWKKIIRTIMSLVSVYLEF